MTQDVSGMNLKEPEQVDWDNFPTGGSYQTPPQAVGADGQEIVYFGQLPTTIVQGETPDQLREYLLDPIKLVKSGPGADGYIVRFTRANLKTWKNGINRVSTLLKAAGVQAKPQKTAEYDAAMNLVKGKVVPITIDWFGKNKETGETIRSYSNFPDNPAQPGTKKAIVKAGDVYTDENGVATVCKSDVIFANAQVKFFRSGAKK